MEHNDTDLFVYEVQVTTQEVQEWTGWDYQKSLEWLQDNWGGISEALDITLDNELQDLVRYANDNN
jgi:hypothetical protein